MTSRVLLTGATGYVGGRMIRRLGQQQTEVRCLVRHPEHLEGRPLYGAEVVRGDVLDRESLLSAMDGVDAAYYFIHSMASTSEFEDADRQAAKNFAEAARERGVRRIIYLGGLGDDSESLSPHLRSRHEVGHILRSAGVQVIEFRASIVIGSGSLSFEMIRALTEKLPIMITPRWVEVSAQPIAINDLLEYLVAGLDLDGNDSRIYEIGGPEEVSYGDLMREYARQRGLSRWMIRVPVLTPRLSSLWLSLVTPAYARVGRALVDSIRHPTLVRDDSALRDFSIHPVAYKDAIAIALRNEDQSFAESSWSDAVSSASGTQTWAGVRFGNRIVDTRTVETPLTPELAFRPIQRIGGRQGWYYGEGLWKLRGLLDVLSGGVGLRRGRRDPVDIRVGDSLDFWRVEAFEPNRRLRLRAEMRLPGRAWLEFGVDERNGGTTIRQTAEFDPLGLAGLAYWYLLYPMHQFIFAGMLREIARADADRENFMGARQPSGFQQVFAFALCLAICFLAAGLGAAVTSTSVGDWYQTINKPTWNPPDWIFGPVWTTLFFLMAVAVWVVWRKAGIHGSRWALGWFGAQLVLNVLWSTIFFGMQSPGWAVLDIAVLWAAIAGTIVAFLGISTPAALLMVPYFLWTSFAAVLNVTVWRLNS